MEHSEHSGYGKIYNKLNTYCQTLVQVGGSKTTIQDIHESGNSYGESKIIPRIQN